MQGARSSAAGRVKAGSATAGPARRAGRRFGLLVLLGAAAVFFGTLTWLRFVEAEVVGATRVDERLRDDGSARPVAEVLRAVRSQKLVTVEVMTRVTVGAGDENWRGEVSARVTAPVKLMYGVDLSALGVEAVAASPLSGAYVVRVPRPSRIATEVYTEGEEVEVTLGWARLRSRAGEYYLGQARRALHDEARALLLSDRDAELVERTTREQLAEVVRRVVGPRAEVAVVFEGPGSEREASAEGTGQKGEGK